VTVQPVPEPLFQLVKSDSNPPFVKRLVTPAAWEKRIGKSLDKVGFLVSPKEVNVKNAMIPSVPINIRSGTAPVCDLKDLFIIFQN
jgi:hypothetical protein